MVLLAACADGGASPAGDAEPVFRLADELACDQDVVALEGGLHAHLVASTDGGRTFDYAPDRPLEARVVGAYDLVTGALSWTRSYASPYWRLDEQVEGEGTAYPDGDLDAAWDRRVERRAGGFVVRHERVVRTGCDQQRVVSTPQGDVVEVEDGTWEKRGYAYTTEVLRDGAKVRLTGLLARDRTRTEHEAWRVGEHELVADTTDDGQGLVKVAFREVKDGTLREGTVVTRPNGTERHLYSERAATWTGDWDYDVDATGTGSGTLVVHPSQGADVTCTVVVTDGTCRFTCPGDGPARC
jgi:hypothetical protein